MTRKISKEEKRRRKMMWQFEQVSKSFGTLQVTAKQVATAFSLMSMAVNGTRPHYNFPETPENSRMHAMYARKKGRAQ